MVSYISNDTVSKPLSAGAKDYILKPFMIEELIRKIDHYQEYEKLKKRNEAYEKYLNYSFSSVMQEYNHRDIKLPVFVTSSFQKYIDAFAFSHAYAKNLSLYFLTLSDHKTLSEIAALPQNALLYIINFQMLKKSDRKAFYEVIANKQVIVASNDKLEDIQYEVLELKCENNIFDQGDILPIEDYVKYIVLHYQNKFPDTELSKKLGISRKSLWEKRKKYDIIKKK